MIILVISTALHDYDDIIKTAGPTNVLYNGIWFTHIKINNELLFFFKLKYRVLPHTTYVGPAAQRVEDVYIIE